VVVLVINFRFLVGSSKQSVYPTFARAGADWRAGSELYEHTEALFRYSPLVAAFFVPFSEVSNQLGEVLWRLLNVGVYLGAMIWWARTCLPRALSRSQTAALFLLALPLSIGSINNGQSNPLVIGLLLAAVAAAQDGRWNLTAFAVALATYFKLYPLAVGLLLVALYPRQLGLRLALALAAGAAAPFLLQDPVYVRCQYASWFHYLLGDMRIDVPLGAANRDLRLLFRVLAIPVSLPLYTAIQLVAAAAIAGLCVAARRAGWPAREALTTLLGWGCCWMLLLGPATESCTYILLAPSLAWATLDASSEPRPLLARCCLAISLILFGVSLVANWFPFARAVHALGPQPFATLWFMGYLAWTDCRRFRSACLETPTLPEAKAA
jgi:hypothetical protein